VRWEIHFEVPDDTDRLIQANGYRKKYLTDKVAEFLQQLLANEAINAVEKDVLSVKPVIYQEMDHENPADD